MKIYGNMEELIGNTPLMRLANIEKEFGVDAKILAKLECFNPTGSAKDRPALRMINDAEKSGKLKPGGMIIEPTSGNTGIGLAAIGAARGYKVVIVMPDTMSIERVKLMEIYGAEVVLTDGKLGMQGSIEKAEEIALENAGSFIAGQFDNPSNPASHFDTTGPEIWNDTDGKVDVFIAGIGTGGTLSGTAEYLKSKNPAISVIGVEPLSAPLLTKGYYGAHDIQGIGANFIPKNLNSVIYDEIIDVSNEDSYEFAKAVAAKEGLVVGISSGAALCAAVRAASRAENAGKTIVTVFTDTGSRYLSTKLFSK